MPDTYDVLEYLTQEGHSPFANWLTQLRDRTARAKIEVRLARVRLGNLGDYAPVGDGVHELRIFYGPGYRVYFGFVRATAVLLLGGGIKPSQRRDIAAAKAHWKDYLSRDHDEKQ